MVGRIKATGRPAAVGGSVANGTPGARERRVSLLFRSVVVSGFLRGASLRAAGVDRSRWMYGVIASAARRTVFLWAGWEIAAWRRPQGLTSGRMVPRFSGVKMGALGGAGEGEDG